MVCLLVIQAYSNQMKNVPMQTDDLGDMRSCCCGCWSRGVGDTHGGRLTHAMICSSLAVHHATVCDFYYQHGNFLALDVGYNPPISNPVFAQSGKIFFQPVAA